MTEERRMTAESIDDDGNFNHEGKRWSLLGSDLPIPSDASVSGKLEHEEVLAVVNTQIPECPVCKEKDRTTTVIMTERYRMVPTRCCKKIIWYMEGTQ
jgi:hypothetical protein